MAVTVATIVGCVEKNEYSLREKNTYLLTLNYMKYEE